MYGHLFEKIILIRSSPLRPQKDDDEQFANHLQMYVSRTFSKAKKICNMRRIPNGLKIPFIQMENIFFPIYW